jgi:hypothetical protein
MVTTNAPIYESNPPLFKDGFLQYKVAGPHFNADQKTLFRGVYDLNLNSEFARCLYGFSNAPISASISVSSVDGTDQVVATEALTEKNGWIHLGAYNFHFSSPVVRVAFQQERKSIVTPSKPSITCKKGKVKRKFVGNKCPIGYKQLAK